MGMSADGDIDPELTHFLGDSGLIFVRLQEILIAPVDIQHDRLGPIRLHIGDLLLHIGVEQFQVRVAEAVHEGGGGGILPIGVVDHADF